MLKKYIRSMLESYRGSHKSAPDSAFALQGTLPPLPQQGNGQVSYIAPADGTLTMQLPEGFLFYSIRVSGRDVFSSQSSPTSSGWPAFEVFVKKGTEVVGVVGLRIKEGNTNTAPAWRFRKSTGS